MPIGICRLCQRQQDLRRSHFMPKALYRDLKDLDAIFAKNRWGKNVVQNKGLVYANSGVNGLYRTDAQYTQYLLCGDCEQRFSDKERFASSLWKSARGFGARQRLVGKPFYACNGGTGYPAHLIFNEEEKAKLLYFMASIVWRADCKGWHRTIDDRLSTLSEERREEFRQFLLGQTDLTECALLVVVDTSSDTPVKMSLPTTEKDHFGCSSFTIIVPGIRLNLLLGSQAPDFRLLSTERLSVGVFGINHTETAMFMSFANMMATSPRRFKED